MPTTPLILMILDGWGYSAETKHNAIAAANTPQWDSWWSSCPHLLIDASGTSVGLPDQQMGNSEVGHMHLGAGRVILQDLTRINQAIAQGDFHKNNTLIQNITLMKSTHKTMHVMGLLSPGGVHSHEHHLFAFLDLCAEYDFSNVVLHLFLDGRDTPPQSAITSLERLEQHLTGHPVATIGSICGRYYAMDRDQRWERVEPVYHLITEGISHNAATTAIAAVQAYYAQGIHDEFIPPTRIGEKHPIHDGDSIFFFNFRSDRARQLTEAYLLPDFKPFFRPHHPHLASFITMTSFGEHLSTSLVFPPMALTHTLGDILAQHGLTQLRLAETEKYAHVTFFFNGGTEHVFPHETRLLIPSPHVKTYDLKPEMSARELTDALVEAIMNRRFDVIICNYANADMVGHTGNIPATIHAIECIDECLRAVGEAVHHVNGHLLITADHGNAECMFDSLTHQAHTAHTSEPVPFLYVGQPGWEISHQSGCLTDIAPTMLALLGIKPPHEMTGHALLHKIKPTNQATSTS